MIWEEPIRLDGLPLEMVVVPVLLVLLAGLIVWLACRRC
jgi:hypothetical protein